MCLSPMTITISNESASVFARGYAHTENGLIVWLEIAPQHPKLTGVIWATLVNGHRAYLQLKDTDKGLGKVVYGLGRAYTHLETDAPTLAVANDGGKAIAARAKLARLVAPEAIKHTSLDQPNYELAWPGLTPEVVLVATLEKAAPYPIRIEWGQYLLEAALERGNATFRQRLNSLARKTRTLVRKAQTLEAGMYVIGCLYNFCDPHHSLRLKLSVGRFGYRWVQRTPAIAAGLADHIWTPSELFDFKVPPPRWQLPKRRGRRSQNTQKLVEKWCS